MQRDARIDIVGTLLVVAIGLVALAPVWLWPVDGADSASRFDYMVKPSGSSERETRDRILAAAHTVFLRRGTAGTRTQEIADEAGINKALLHYYFGTKAALADAVFEQALGTILPRIFGILADPNRTIAEKVPAIVREQIDFHAARPYLAGYLISEMHAEPDRVARLVARRGEIPLGVLRRQLRQGARAGTLRPISAEQFVVSLMGLLIFPFAVRPALGPLLQLDDSAWPAFLKERRRLLPDLFLAGLRP
jgi:AcrR family transcriptional regulator